MDGDHPPDRFLEGSGIGKQRRSVTIHADPEQNHIEARHLAALGAEYPPHGLGVLRSGGFLILSLSPHAKDLGEG